MKTKAIITNYRYYLLLIIALVGIVGIMAAPEDSLSLARWMWVLFCSKAVGVGACYLFYHLVNRWGGKGKIPELKAFAEDF